MEEGSRCGSVGDDEEGTLSRDALRTPLPRKEGVGGIGIGIIVVVVVVVVVGGGGGGGERQLLVVVANE
jgi:hypothetical protein